MTAPASSGPTRLVALLFVALGCWTSPAHASAEDGGATEESLVHGDDSFEAIADFSRDHRLRRAGRPVGRLVMRFEDRRGNARVRYCTATLVGDGRALTAAHCVSPPKPGMALASGRLELGYLSTRQTGESVEISVPPLAVDAALDAAVLAVDGQPETRWGAVSVAKRVPTRGQELVVIHHPKRRPQRVTRFRCRAGTVRDASFSHSCDTLPGSSGAPVFADGGRESAGLALAGVHVRGSGSGAYPNSAIPLTALLSESSRVASSLGRASGRRSVPRSSRVASRRPHAGRLASIEAVWDEGGTLLGATGNRVERATFRGSVHQTWHRNTSYRSAVKKIRTAWKKGRDVTAFTRTKAGNYVTVTSSLKKTRRQAVASERALPLKLIARKQREGYVLTSLNYAHSWNLVFTEHPSADTQRVVNVDTYGVRATIKAVWQAGRRIQQVARGPEGWVIVSARGGPAGGYQRFGWSTNPDAALAKWNDRGVALSVVEDGAKSFYLLTERHLVRAPRATSKTRQQASSVRGYAVFGTK